MSISPLSTSSLRRIEESFQLLTPLSAALVTGAEGVTVTLKHHDRLTTVAATDESVDLVDRAQYDTRQGPCVSATLEGRQQHAPSLSQESRWPRFTSRALAAGFAAILSTPLLVSEAAAGALNVYSRRENVFGAGDMQLTRLLASHAAAFLARVDEAPGNDADLELALHSREVIAQGQGVLMERYGSSADEAYATLRDSARQAETTLKQQAIDLVISTTRRDRLRNEEST